MEDVTVAERLTLISEIIAPGDHRPRFLAEPVLVQKGQRYWFDEQESVLVVEDLQTGRVKHRCAYKTGPDAIR